MANLLTNMFNMELKYVRQTDEEFGPLDWRLPETHAIYWSVIGMDKGRTGDPMVLYRMIWQAMKLAFDKGTVNINPHNSMIEFSPNLEIIGNVNKTFEKMKLMLPEKADYVARGQEFFLHDAIYFLYLHGREESAAEWYRYLGSHQFKADYTWVRDMPLGDFVMLRIQNQINGSSPYNAKGIIEAYVQNFYYNLALGRNEKARGNALFARKTYNVYHERFSKSVEKIQGFSSFKSIQMSVLFNSLSGQGRFRGVLADRLRIVLGLPQDWRKNLTEKVLDNIEEKATASEKKKGDGSENDVPSLKDIVPRTDGPVPIEKK